MTILHILQLPSKEETIPNDYTQRNTPSTIALGGRQRFIGVLAENQRNLKVKNTVSYFKNFLGSSYKDEHVQNKLNENGANIIELEDGSVGFNIMENTYRPEHILTIMFTKVKDIVKILNDTSAMALLWRK